MVDYTEWVEAGNVIKMLRHGRPGIPVGRGPRSCTVLVRSVVYSIRRLVFETDARSSAIS